MNRTGAIANDGQYFTKLVELLVNKSKDVNLYEDLMLVMRDSSICGLGQAATNCLKHLLEFFPEDLHGAR